MTDASESPGFDDVNEAVVEEWTTETTPAERIREVVAHAYEPVSANEVAEDAHTSPKTARKHLEALATEGFVSTEPGENGGTDYRRSAESLVVEQAADILSNVSVDELVERVAEMRETVRDFQVEYGVESPTELTVEQTNETLTADSGAEQIDAEALREWQTTRRNLAFANAALSIANARKFVGGESGETPAAR